MPAFRVTPITASARSQEQASRSKPYSRSFTTKITSKAVSQPASPDSTLTFPADLIARSRFRLPSGKAVTGHQWKVRAVSFDCCSNLCHKSCRLNGGGATSIEN